VSAAERVTDNASVTGNRTVTRNDCPDCATGLTPNHYPCDWCGACPGKKRRREDRRYCSSTCRHAAWQYRHSPEGIARREAWEASDRYQQFRAMGEALRAINGDARPLLPFSADEVAELVPDDVQSWRDTEDKEAAADLFVRLRLTAARTADVCGDCGTRLYPSEMVYRAPEHPRSAPSWRGIVYPSCLSCRCRQRDAPVKSSEHGRLCEHCHWYAHSWVRWDAVKLYCKDAGPDHGGPYCTDCHPKAWRPERPCEGCGRPVVNHQSVRPGYRRDGRHVMTQDYANPNTWRVFCSERCRRSVFSAEQTLKRRHDLTPCTVCGSVGRDGTEGIYGLGPIQRTVRSDARYCSPACRQRAYRARCAPGNVPSVPSVPPASPASRCASDRRGVAPDDASLHGQGRGHPSCRGPNIQNGHPAAGSLTYDGR
jgi:hypothetical protein